MPKTWAILIGVNTYPERIPSLYGCANDVADFEAFLSQNCSPLEVAKLTCDADQSSRATTVNFSTTVWPTKENVIKKTEFVTQHAAAGDDVYFYFSGHGAKEQDSTRAYREKTRSDAALVLLTQTATDVSLLHGIELAEIFNVFVQRGLRLRVTLDSCHAGAISRGDKLAQAGFRGVKWSTIQNLVSRENLTPPEDLMSGLDSSSAAEKDSRNRDGRSTHHWLLRPNGYSLLAACSPHERAREVTDQRTNRTNGCLSYHISRALRNASLARLPLSMGAIYNEVAAKMRGSQNPMLFGIDSSSFLSTKEAQQETFASCNVTKTESFHSLPPKIWLSVGQTHGVTVRDEYAIFPNAIDRGLLDLSHSIVLVQVVTVNENDCETVIVEQRSGSVPRGSLALLIRRQGQKALVLLHCDIGQTLQLQFDKSIWVGIGTKSMKLPPTAPYFHVHSVTENTFSIELPDGQRIPGAAMKYENIELTRENLLDVSEHLSKFSFVATIQNYSPISALPDSAFALEAFAVDEPGPAIVSGVVTVKHNHQVCFKIKNNTERPLFVTGIDLTPGRKIFKVVPGNDGGQWSMIEPGLRLVVTLEMEIPESLMAAGKKEVEETLKFFISTKPSSFDMLGLPDMAELVRFSDPKIGAETDSKIRNGVKHLWTSRNVAVRTML